MGSGKSHLSTSFLRAAMSDPLKPSYVPSTQYRSLSHKRTPGGLEYVYDPALPATHDVHSGLQSSMTAWHIYEGTKCPGTSSTQRMLHTSAHIPATELRQGSVRELRKQLDRRRAGLTRPPSGGWPSNEDLNRPGFELRFDGTIGLNPFLGRSQSLPALASPRLRVTQQPLSPYQSYDPYKAPTPPEKQWLPPWHSTESWARYTTPTWKRRAEFPGELVSPVKDTRHKKWEDRDKMGYRHRVQLR